MAIRVQGPDGVTIEFPDGTDRSTITGVMQKRYGTPKQETVSSDLGDAQGGETVRANAATAAPSALAQDMRKNDMQAEYDAKPWYAKAATAADDIARIGLDGASLGFMDKAAAGINSIMPGGQSYADELAAQRQSTQDARARAGWAGTAADVVGSAATGGAAAKAGLTAMRAVPAGMAGITGLGARTGAMAVDGAAMGAGSALGHDADVGAGAGIGAAAGAAGNLAGTAISKGVEKVAGAFRQRPQAPTIDEVQSLRDAAYKRAEGADVMFSPQAVLSARDRVAQAYADHGFHPTNEPGAATVIGELERLASAGMPVTMKGIETARKMTGNAYVAGNNSNNTLLGRARDEMDAMITSPAAGDILSGNAQMAAQAIKDARGLHSRAMKAEGVQDAISAAEKRAATTGSGGNIDNAIRQEIRKWEGRQRGLTPDEESAAMQAMTASPAHNAARLLGKLSPSGNGLMAALGVGAAAANPIMAIPAIVGIGAKTISDNATKKNVDKLMKVILSGGSKDAAFGTPNSVERLAKEKRDALVRAMMSGGIVSSNDYARSQ